MNAFFTRRLTPLALPAVLFLLLAACTAVPTRPAPVDLPAALSQQSLLAAQLGLDVADVEITAVDAVTFADGCLELGSPVELCLAAETPGHRFTLTAGGNGYVYHSNADGSHIRLASAPEVTLARTLIAWTGSDDTGCHSARISGERVAFGGCYAPQINAPLANDDRRADIADFAQTFSPFSADTPAGTVEFSGAGTQVATPAQQRMLAEWARLVHQEASLGRSGASWGLALTYHREGGRAGLCNDVSVYRDGTAFANACGAASAQLVNRFRLGTHDLAALYGWLDQYANFEQEWDSKADSDRLVSTLVFAGEGTETAHEPDQILIADFALNLYLESTLALLPLPANCAGPEEGQQLLLHEEGNYCLLYPARYSLWNHDGVEVTEIISRTVMNHVTPRLSIVVQPADGRSLEDAAAAFLAEFSLPAGENQPEHMIVGERDALLLDEMPGPDFIRRLVIVDNDRLYTLVVAPLGDRDTATRRQADELFNLAAATFRFLGDDLSGVDEAIVDSLEVNVLESFPLQAQAVIRGHLPDACSFVEKTVVEREGPTFRIRLTTARHPNMRCAQVLTPFEEVVALDVKELPSGTYDVRLGELVTAFELGSASE